jgi:hypothetical protein
MNQYTSPFFDLYPEFAEEFAYIQFFTIIVTAVLSNLLTGIICDWLERSYFFAKPFMCILKAICGVIFCLVIFSVQKHFYVCVTGLFFDYLFSKGWQPIAISLLRAVVDS